MIKRQLEPPNPPPLPYKSALLPLRHPPLAPLQSPTSTSSASASVSHDPLPHHAAAGHGRRLLTEDGFGVMRTGHDRLVRAVQQEVGEERRVGKLVAKLGELRKRPLLPRVVVGDTLEDGGVKRGEAEGKRVAGWGSGGVTVHSIRTMHW